MPRRAVYHFRLFSTIIRFYGLSGATRSEPIRREAVFVLNHDQLLTTNDPQPGRVRNSENDLREVRDVPDNHYVG